MGHHWHQSFQKRTCWTHVTPYTPSWSWNLLIPLIALMHILAIMLNNARSLSTPLLLCSRLSDNHTLQSFGHCSAWCARLGSACLVSFLENEWLLYLLAPDPHLDHACICILYASPHAMSTWISYQACQGFLHGISSLFSFCIGRDDTHTFCIFIYQAQSFPIELVIWLDYWTLGSLS